MPRTAYQMPVRTDLAARVGPRLWRKTILRPGHISKGGIELDVDRPYMESLVRSFQSGAKDQVQLVFANSGNQHDESPEQYRGEVIDLRLTDDDRLDAIVATTARGDKALSENRRLGVSPSLETNFSRADGRAGEAVLLHICGTLDPEVSKLGEWARADLSAEYDQVIDLTSADVSAVSRNSATHAAAGSGGKPSHREGGAAVPTLTDEDRQMLDQLGGLLPTLSTLVTRFNDNGDTDEGADDQSGDKGKADKGKPSKGKTSRKPAADDNTGDDTDDNSDDGDGDEFDDTGFTEAELAALAAGADDGDGEGERLAASADERVTQLQLSHRKLSAERDQDKVELARLRRKDDVREYEKLRGELAQQHRVPPYITDLCREVLEGEGRLQLSADKTVNVRDMVVKALSQLAQVGPLDLSAAQGTAHDVSAAKVEDEQMNKVIEMAKSRRFGM